MILVALMMNGGWLNLRRIQLHATFGIVLLNDTEQLNRLAALTPCSFVSPPLTRRLSRSTKALSDNNNVVLLTMVIKL